MCDRGGLTARVLPLLMALLVQLMGLSCSEKINTAVSLANYLPDQTASGLQKSSDIRQYNRETLSEHLDNGADIYLDHGFVELATADYRRHDLKFTADMYEFESAEKAQRLFAIIRPPDVLQRLDIGQGGYLDPGVLVFVHGRCLVRLTGYIDTDESQGLLKSLAEAVVRRMQVQQDGKTG